MKIGSFKKAKTNSSEFVCSRHRASPIRWRRPVFLRCKMESHEALKAEIEALKSKVVEDEISGLKIAFD